MEARIYNEKKTVSSVNGAGILTIHKQKMKQPFSYTIYQKKAPPKNLKNNLKM